MVAFVSGVLGHRHFLLVTFVLAALVRLTVILVSDVRPEADFEWYVSRGQDLAAGRGYVVHTDGFPMWSPGERLAVPRHTAFWPVGFPSFLACVFTLTGWLLSPVLAMQLANVGLYLGLMAVCARMARRTFGNDLAGRAAVLVLAFLPNHIAYATLASSEIFFALLLVVSIELVLSARESKAPALLWAAGITFGAATLTKPQVAILPVLMVVWLARRSPRTILADLARVGVPMAVVLAPWVIRNHAAFGVPVLVSTNGGINLLIGNMPGAFDNSEGVVWNETLGHIVRTFEDEISWNRQARSAALRYIAAHPVETLLRVPGKVASLWAFDVDGVGWMRSGSSAQKDSPLWLLFRIAAQAYYFGLVVAAALAFWKTGLLRRHRARVSLAVMGYFTCICAVFFGAARFHFSLVPFIGVLAAGYLSFVASGAGAGSRAPRAG